MPFANASATQLAYIRETSWGQTPTMPEFNLLRFTAESLSIAKETTVSNEIRPDRNVSDIIRVFGGASGGIQGELSYGAYDDLIESMFASQWTANKIKNGVEQISFTLEKKYLIGAVPNYMRMSGMVVNTMSWALESKGIATVSIDFLGKGGEANTTEVAGVTYLPAVTTDVMSASNDFGTVVMSGLTSPKIMGLTIEMSNNLIEAPIVGSPENAEIGMGRFTANGTLNAYFENLDMYGKFLDGEALSLEFVAGLKTGEKYSFNFPKIKFTGGEIQAGGNDQYVMCAMNYQALYDPTLGATVEIERAVV